MRKRIFAFTVIGLVFSAAAFGGTNQIQLDELQSSLDKLLELFTSNIMKSIFAVGLAGLLVGFGLNRENGELKKRFLFWIIATGGLLGLSSIMDVFFSEGALL